MPLTVVLRALVILVVFIQLSCCSSLPVRNKRHVDGMFTSEFSRARGSAAIRKIINSALAGKRDVEESSYRTGPQVDLAKKELPGLAENTYSELRLDDQALNDTPQNQLCSAILNLLSRMPLQSPQLHNKQVDLDNIASFLSNLPIGHPKVAFLTNGEALEVPRSICTGNLHKISDTSISKITNGSHTSLEDVCYYQKPGILTYNYTVCTEVQDGFTY